VISGEVFDEISFRLFYKTRALNLGLNQGLIIAEKIITLKFCDQETVEFVNELNFTAVKNDSYFIGETA
jgi:hypothetical protein